MPNAYCVVQVCACLRVRVCVCGTRNWNSGTGSFACSFAISNYVLVAFAPLPLLRILALLVCCDAASDFLRLGPTS